MGSSIRLREFEARDISAARALWEKAEGVGLSAADELPALAAFLARNPRSSYVITDDHEVVGTILCGHDGRRGLIHHLVIAPKYRRRGLARTLLQRGLSSLRDAGIHKCHLLVFRSNDGGVAFWRKVGAEERASLTLFSMSTEYDG
jgi:ribosomal protein S18 acetylase RimI-like enzyme